MTRSDARDRIIDAAVARLHRRGLAVALDGISLEEAIADSGVARATAYRRWPNRAEFTREVLVRAVHSVELEPETPEDLGEVRALLEGRREQSGTESGRHAIVVEALRLATGADHRRLASSREWRDYLALRVTCEGLPDQDLRQTLMEELRAAERRFVRHRAGVYAQITAAFGYRLATPVTGEAGFTLLAEMMGALMTGLILDPAAGERAHSFRARAFGSDIEAEWTTASYSLTAALLTHLEPDSPAGWDPERALRHLDGMIAR